MSPKEATVHRRAAELRNKYFVGRYRVRPGHIAFDPSNRGGQAPHGERCVQLLKDILRDGYDPQEGDHAGILVQEAPGKNIVQAFNDRALQGDPLLTPSIEGIAAQYGSLSHSHLNQVFKNILGKLPLGVPEISDREGRACVKVLAEVDEKLAKACEEGLMWEILSHKIRDEEERGCEIIQAAANSKNAVAMTYHEMELLSSLSKWCSRTSAMAEKMTFANAKEAMLLTYPGLAGEEDFVKVFNLVIDLGAEKAPFLGSLQAFTSRFVNPQLRRLRLHAFACVADLALEHPRLKVAILKWCYTQHPKRGFCPSPDCAKVKQHPSVALVEAELALKGVHVGMASLIGELKDEYSKVQWLGNVDSKVAGVLLEAKASTNRATLQLEMGKHISALCVKLAELLGKGNTERVKTAAATHLPKWVTWPTGDTEATEAPSAMAEESLRPKVIAFDSDGNPLGGQDARSKKQPKPEEIPVADWLELKSVQDTNAAFCARSIVASVLQVVQAAYVSKILELKVKVMRCKGVVTVVAEEDINKRSLAIPVAAMNASSIVSAGMCSHPRAVNVMLKENAASDARKRWPEYLPARDYMVTPELSLPKTPSMEGGAYDWKVNNCSHLFWVIPRHHDDQQWNCEIFNLEVTQAHALLMPDKTSATRVFNVSVPALRNTKPIKKDEAIVLKWPKPKDPPKKDTKTTTWIDAAQRDAKKQKTSH